VLETVEKGESAVPMTRSERGKKRDLDLQTRKREAVERGFVG